MAHELEQRGAALPAGWFRPEVPPVVPIPSYEAGLDYCRAAAAAFIQSERLTSGSYELYCEIGGRIIQTKDVALIRQAKGTRCDTPDGWFCLRPSGTEPIIRIAVECRSRDVARRWSRRLQEMVVEEKLSAGQE